MSERRITVEQVKRAYEIVGLRPMCRDYFNYILGCCCPQTALYLVHHRDDLTKVHIGGLVNVWAERNYGREYAESFRQAFDRLVDADSLVDALCNSFGERNVERIRQGVEDGNACQRELGLTQSPEKHFPSDD